MEHSEQLEKLGVALAKAQDEMVGAKKGSDNPFFKSKYADLTSVWQACKEALHNNGLSVIQAPISEDGRIGVSTMLLHSSGQYIKDKFTLGVKKENDPQADGSSITYARRYALAAFVGVCPADDDAEGAMNRSKKQQRQKNSMGYDVPNHEPPKVPSLYEQLKKELDENAKLGGLDSVLEYGDKNKNRIANMLQGEDLANFRAYFTKTKNGLEPK
jgi:hypothetical protein